MDCERLIDREMERQEKRKVEKERKKAQLDGKIHSIR